MHMPKRRRGGQRGGDPDTRRNWMGFEYRHGPVSRFLHDRGWKGTAYFLNKLTGWGGRRRKHR